MPIARAENRNSAPLRRGGVFCEFRISSFEFRVPAIDNRQFQCYRGGSGVIWHGIRLATPVIPAKAGIQSVHSAFPKACEWIPAFAGMTGGSSGSPCPMTPVPPCACYCQGVALCIKVTRRTREHRRPGALGISKPEGITRTGGEFGGRGGGPEEGNQTA